MRRREGKMSAVSVLTAVRIKLKNPTARTVFAALASACSLRFREVNAKPSEIYFLKGGEREKLEANVWRA